MDAPKEQKEMVWLEGKLDMQGPSTIKLHINYSSMSLINACLRKTYYSLEQNLRASEDEHIALTFGKAIHKALETWYCHTTEERKTLPPDLTTKIVKVLHGEPVASLHPAILAAGEFLSSVESSGQTLPEGDDKRGLYNAAKILSHYFTKYKDDGIAVLRIDGIPQVERRLEHLLDVFFYAPTGQTIQVYYHGTVDAIMYNRENVFVADHKTTSILGSQFFDRIKPNHQYTGYLWLANSVLGIDTNLFMVNGIQVAKTKTDCARQFTQRDADDLDDFFESVLETSRKYVDAKWRGKWPINAPDQCTNWGNCQYLKICQAPKQLRESIIRSYEGK